MRSTAKLRRLQGVLFFDTDTLEVSKTFSFIRMQPK